MSELNKSVGVLKNKLEARVVQDDGHPWCPIIEIKFDQKIVELEISTGEMEDLAYYFLDLSKALKARRAALQSP